MGNLVSNLVGGQVKYNLDKAIIESTLRSLEEIQTTLDGLSADKDRCLQNYKKWQVARRRTISALAKCQNELDTIHIVSSAGRAIGTGASILGGLATVVGFGLSFSNDLKPLGKELMTYGTVVGTAGGTAAVASNIAGKGFSAKVLREVKLALEEDQRLTENLLPWFRRAIELTSLFQEVFDCTVLPDISDIFAVMKEMVALCRKGDKTLTDITNYLSLSVQGNFSPKQLQNLNNEKLERILLNAGEKVTTLLLGFSQSPRVQKAIGTLFESLKRNPDLFQLPKASSCIVRKMKNQENNLTNVISLTGGRSVMNFKGCIFQTIGVVFNVYAFLAAVEDMKEGRSKYSEVIEKTKTCLLLELKALESNPELVITKINAKRIA